MNQEQFKVFIDIVYTTGTASAAVATGYLAIDPNDESAKVQRAIEFLDKIITLSRVGDNGSFNQHERNELKPILDFGDLEIFRDRLIEFWAHNRPAFRR